VRLEMCRLKLEEEEEEELLYLYQLSQGCSDA
jgi:hypothetical protein